MRSAALLAAILLAAPAGAQTYSNGGPQPGDQGIGLVLSTNPGPDSILFQGNTINVVVGIEGPPEPTTTTTQPPDSTTTSQQDGNNGNGNGGNGGDG